MKSPSGTRRRAVATNPPIAAQPCGVSIRVTRFDGMVHTVSKIVSAGTLRCAASRSEEHTSELQSLMRISYAVFCLKKKNTPCTTPQSNSHDKIIKSNHTTPQQTSTH